MSHRPWFTANLIGLSIDLIKMCVIPAVAVAVAWALFPALFPLVAEL